MLETVWKEIDQYEKIILHRHVSPDPDAYGSQLGLATLIKHRYPNKLVKCVGYSETSLSWMGVMDEASDADFAGALVLVMDTGNAKRIDDERYKSGAYCIKIDHHPPVEDYGDLNVVDTSLSSTSEFVVNLYEKNKAAYDLEMTKEAATLLYAGIIADSGRFLYDNSSQSTYVCVANLLDYEVDRAYVHENMYKRTLNMIQAQGYVLSNFSVSDHGVAYFKMTKEVQAMYGLTTATRSALVNVLSNIEGIHVWVCFFENEENIRVNIRSGGPIINTVAETFEGGGHPKASGAIIYDWDSCEHVVAALDVACIQYLEAKKS
ncbi:MAG TPA: bifunctional oligoribonuclease/PAP phosphatase NrnA [Firmicutes bacterium]|nr:bifunctional oligoribonuclease/PAP phosphatase NrnA [Bacillota bacterium]